MNRLHYGLLLGLVLASTAVAQDSGPGPVDPATEQAYDVNLYQRGTATTGQFKFLAPEDATTSNTTGDFEATIDTEIYTGTYHAYDLGEYSFWAAHGEGETNGLTVYGWATPDIVVGRASLSSSSGGWFSSFFSRNRYWFYGTPAEPAEPAEPTDPTGT